VLGTYALAQLLGNCIALSTATARNGSAKILRRLGGRPVAYNDTELPPYFDPHYGCQMELLWFDSREPNPKYAEWVDYLQCELVSARVICSTERQAARKIFPIEITRGYQQRL
jgi:hypothetical protein